MSAITGQVLEGDALALMARIRDVDGEYPAPADFSAITYKVVDLTASAARVVVAPTSLTPANVVYAALQTGAGWSVDETGYNFRMILPASTLVDDAVFTEGNFRQYRTYQVVVKFVPAASVDYTFYARWELKVENNVYERP